jgi:hypothetical protein
MCWDVYTPKLVTAVLQRQVRDTFPACSCASAARGQRAASQLSRNALSQLVQIISILCSVCCSIISSAGRNRCDAHGRPRVAKETAWPARHSDECLPELRQVGCIQATKRLALS